MKKKTVGRLGVVALALTLISTCLMGGTLAKYTTEVTGTGSATVAKWNFTANGKTDTFEAIDLASTAYTNVAEEKIAPGTEGSFDIKLDASGSEVAVAYTIAFTDVKNQPKNLKFYTDAGHITEFNLDDGLKGTIEFANVDTAVTKTIYWQWAYETNSGDADDTTNGTAQDAARNMTFNIKVTGTQVAPEKSTAP